ncbi:hypothetical protein [Aliivibrio fischeri]|uniref:hypothetical protein n=1 Tax=Aliivibrio fischeri TaxID=668 RepID=UPI0006D26ADD|nr:hypothetical protein [Aliivibrio fischeri]USR97090.1 hypothetical protein AVFI_18060 [Aliivibrio fischeri ATCC 7744 = JCM 18803 = DSM 507]GGK50050.1 hypothetical protein GCM10007987_36420 [Aliivibrio fischeri]
MAITIDFGDIVSTFALILSSYATWKTVVFNKRQKSLIDSQERLNKLLVDKETGEVLSDKKADLSANIIHLGNNKYKLKVLNKGKSVARNVRIEFPEGNHIVIDSEIHDKFPLESLETFGSVELIAIVHTQTPSKHTIKLLWADDYRNNNEKLVYPTV